MRLDTVTLEPIDVMVVRDTGEMPEAAGRAFQRLESALPSLKGRKFYGYWDPDAKAYVACVASLPSDDAAAMGFDRATIPGGRYQRARLIGEPPALYAGIGNTFEEMAETITDLDRDRPWLEFYRARDQVDLLVPVA
jgi:hypothetical protein